MRERRVRGVGANQSLGQRQQRVGRRPFARVHAAEHHHRTARASADLQHVDRAPLVRALRQHAQRAHVGVLAGERLEALRHGRGVHIAGHRFDAHARTDRGRPQLLGALEQLHAQPAVPQGLRDVRGGEGGDQPGAIAAVDGGRPDHLHVGEIAQRHQLRPRPRDPQQLHRPRLRHAAGATVRRYAPLVLPEGFAVGHWTDAASRTGCTVVIPPPGARGGVDVRGGGTGTRELDLLSPLANAEGPTAVLLTGGSAFGLAAADGVVRWLEERGRGRPTPFGVVPLVSAAVVFDLAEGEGRRPGPSEGYAACEAANGGAVPRGRVGAGTGAAVGKALGRERAAPGGVGCAATHLPSGETLAALAVANAWGDVIAADGQVLGGPRDARGGMSRAAELIRDMPDLPGWALGPGQSTTLVCLCTDAPLDKRGCGIVARIASARRGARGRPGVHAAGRGRGVLPRVRRSATGRARRRGLVGAHAARHGRREPHGGRDPRRGATRRRDL